MRSHIRKSPWRALVAAVLAAVLTAAALVVTASSASAAGNRLMLRALVVDNGQPWAKAMQDQFTMEGVPFTTVTLGDTDRPTITPAFLASDTTANFNAVILPEDQPAGLAAAELAALAAFESQFGVRQVNMYNWANPTVGLNYAQAPGYIGDLTGMTGTATAVAKADGFGYLAGDVPIGVGSYGFLATPAGEGVMPVGGTFTPYVSVPIPGTSEVGSLVGVYSNGGVEKLVITGAMSATLSHFRILAHGIVTWATRGVHLGHNRNYFSFHFDDAFSYDARWDQQNNCTPGEDCPSTVTTTPDPIRMTPSDVTAVVNWQKANGFTVTLPFNAYHTQYDDQGVAWSSPDPLTQAFVANRADFRWLNHGYEHIFQGCVQDFTVVPWVCETTDGNVPDASGSNLTWVPQTTVASEISTNVARGQALGLSFDTAEYLSGEHSGLFRLPQQVVDNPNFAAALAANDIKIIGADASREPGARTVGSSTTVPRYPVAVYFNAATEAENVDEYNWFYTTREDGGSGYCEDNPATATCIPAPLSLETGFESYIVPTDAANDLRFVLSNDPRPFYAHVSNLVGSDYLGLQLMTEILRQYRIAMAANAPVVNLTLTQASDMLTKQQAWRTAGLGANPSVTGYVQDGVVTVTNPSSVAAPLTLPEGAVVNGADFGQAYGGERSGWVSSDATVRVSSTRFTSATSAAFTAGTADSLAVTTASTEGVPALTVSGALPAGVTFTDNGNGAATLAGTPPAGSGGIYPLTLTATTASGPTTQSFTLTVAEKPVITSAVSAAAAVGQAFSFTVATSGYPTATLTRTGTLPAGLTFTTGTGGTATISGTPSSAATLGTYLLTLTATSPSGTTTQAFTLALGHAPSITSSATGTATIGEAFTKSITTSGSPAATLTVTGLPQGLTFTPTTPGQGTISGPAAAGTSGVRAVVVTATNVHGTATQNLALTVREKPQITSASSMTARVRRSTSFTVTSTGYPTATVSRSGTLPVGLVFTAKSNGTATISGTPLSRGTTRITLTATNSAGSVNQTFTINITK
ncbi:MAG: putative Ig domain-containing protein [Kineosporiaceae bacterium]